MHRLNELALKLTPAQIRELEDFAEFLLTRQPSGRKKIQEEFLDVNRIAGMFEGLAPELTAVELAHEANEIRVSKYMK